MEFESDFAGKSNLISHTKIDAMILDCKIFVILFVMFLTILGPLFVITAVGFISINALGRHPSAAPEDLAEDARPAYPGRSGGHWCLVSVVTRIRNKQLIGDR